MSTAQPQTRQQLHTRTITCLAFARDDALVDIEGTLLDIKHQQFVLPERGIVEPGQAIHEMKLIITIDRDFVILDAKAMTLHSPYRICGAINDSYRQLIGLRIASGFTQQVKLLFRGIAGCSHLTELLPAMATTAFQVIWAVKEKFIDIDPNEVSVKRSTPLGGCHALRQDGEVIKLYFPQYYRPRGSTGDDA